MTNNIIFSINHWHGNWISWNGNHCAGSPHPSFLLSGTGKLFAFQTQNVTYFIFPLNITHKL